MFLMNCFLEFGKVAYSRNRHNTITAMTVIIFRGHSPLLFVITDQVSRDHGRVVDGGGLENLWVKASRVRILLPPPKISGHVVR